MKKGLIALAIVFVSVFGFSQATLQAQDCDNNAVKRCGFLNVVDMKNHYNANTQGIQPVFNHYGISSANVNSNDWRDGSVTKSGNVVVNGKTVATGARSVGRQYIAPSTKVTIAGKTFYERSTSTSFRSNSLKALVLIVNGQFKGAILYACGNPVVAVPNTPPPPPPPVKPEAKYACVDLKVAKINRNTVDATVVTQEQNALFASVTYITSDGQTIKGGGKTHRITFSKPGTYTIDSSVRFGTDDGIQTVVDKRCSKTVTITQEPAYKCVDLKLAKIDKNSYSATVVTATSGDASYSSVKFLVSDGRTISSNGKTQTINFTNPGIYTISTVVSFTVEGSTKTVTDKNCSGQAYIIPKTEVKECKPGIPVGDERCEEKKVAYECTDLRVSKISRDTYEFTVVTNQENATYTSTTFNYGDTTTSTGSSKTVRKTYATPGNYTVTATPAFQVNNETKEASSVNCKVTVTVAPDECKPGIPVGDERCEEKPEYCDVPGKEHLPVNSPDCEETPITPTELPKTGVGENIVSVIGAGSLIAAVGYYGASRRSLS